MTWENTRTLTWSEIVFLATAGILLLLLCIGCAPDPEDSGPRRWQETAIVVKKKSGSAWTGGWVIFECEDHGRWQLYKQSEKIDVIKMYDLEEIATVYVDKDGDHFLTP